MSIFDLWLPILAATFRLFLYELHHLDSAQMA